MRRIGRLLIGMALLPGLFGASPQPRPAGADTAGRQVDRDVYNLILLAPARPLFVRLFIQVDGAGLKSVRMAYAARLLGQYDRDGDGLLDQEESKRVPPLVKSTNASETFSIAESWVSVDRDPADDRISPAELADWIDRVLGFPFSLSARPERATQSVDLFSLLDLNHDGRLSRGEQSSALHSLHKLDLDEDETFTIDELQPLRSPQAPGQAVNAPSADQPFLSLESDDAIQAAASRLIERYSRSGDETASASVSGLGPSELGCDLEACARYDANGDGVLDVGELPAFLREAPPQVELAAQLFLSKPGRPKLSALNDQLAVVTAETKGPGDQLSLAAGSVEIKWRVKSNRGSTVDNRKIYGIEFLKADADKNGYLDEQEFARVGIPNATFAQVDRDGNGMVVKDEVLGWVDQEATTSQTRIEMIASHDGKSVFEVLDANLDRRLSLRELRQAIELLKGFDRDQDGEITAVELAGQYKVVLELGKPAKFRNENAPRMDGSNTAPTVTRTASGPDWFNKMDRNRDGDVSRREFLGSPGLFRKLDADGDGLITVGEASATSEP